MSRRAAGRGFGCGVVSPAMCWARRFWAGRLFEDRCAEVTDVSSEHRSQREIGGLDVVTPRARARPVRGRSRRVSVGAMSTLTDRPNTALLVIDVQNDVVASAHDRDAVVATIADLVDKARASAVPVVWVQHHDDGLVEGSDGWQYVPELTIAESEPVVHKAYGDSFEATDLEDVLASRGVGRLVVAGAQTDQCIRSTLHGAFVRGYDVTLVGDAHTTEDLSEWGAPTPDLVIAHTNMYWNEQDAPGRAAATVSAADVTF